MLKVYAGIGSRETPADICEDMTRIAVWLRGLGYTLRSGGAEGADKAFEKGAADKKEIFVPWRGFGPGHVLSDAHADACRLVAAKFHPKWSNLKEGARKLHTRNVAQVLGCDTRMPSAFVVCWTKDGHASGGTGQALRIAAAYDIPVFNLYWPNAHARLIQQVTA